MSDYTRLPESPENGAETSQDERNDAPTGQEPYHPDKVWTWPKADRDAYTAKLEAFMAGYDPETDDPGEQGEMDDPEYRERVYGAQTLAGEGPGGKPVIIAESRHIDATEDWGAEEPNHSNGHTLY